MNSKASTTTPNFEPDDENFVTIFRRFKIDALGNKIFPRKGKKCFAMRVPKSPKKDQ